MRMLVQKLQEETAARSASARKLAPLLSRNWAAKAPNSPPSCKNPEMERERCERKKGRRKSREKKGNGAQQKPVGEKKEREKEGGERGDKERES